MVKEKEKKRVLILDRYQYAILLNALNDVRTGLINEQKATDGVDELLIKTVKAPEKRRMRVVCKSETR